MDKLEWEFIESSFFHEERTYRSKVKNGWLVRIIASGYRDQNRPQLLTFVPDEYHTWRVGNG